VGTALLRQLDLQEITGHLHGCQRLRPLCLLLDLLELGLGGLEALANALLLDLLELGFGGLEALAPTFILNLLHLALDDLHVVHEPPR
jgi:hypothetical protein